MSYASGSSPRAIRGTFYFSMRVLSYCLMPNHFHLVLFPLEDGDLSRWMQWLTTCHVRRYHKHYHSTGHVWQGRFKAFPIQRDQHLLTVLCYVERNPVRAGLVHRAEDWPWSSARANGGERRPEILADWPIDRPDEYWCAYVNRPQTGAELDAIRNAANRGTPFGNPGWVAKTAARLGLEASVRARGRPQKK